MKVLLYLCDVRMDTPDDLDEDELLDHSVQMIIQESCQREQLTASGRYNTHRLHHQFQKTPSSF